MSLILEALKKSEARRRLGNAPDLSTPFATAQPRRGLLPYLIIAIASIGGIGWWVLHSPAAPVAPVTTKATPVQQTPARQTPAVAQHSLSGTTNPTRSNTNQEPSIWVAAQRPQTNPTGQRGRMPRNPGLPRAERPSTQILLRHPMQPVVRPAMRNAVTASSAQPKKPTASATKATPAPEAALPEHPRADSAPPDPTRMVAGPGTTPTKPALPAEASTAPTNVPPYYQLEFDVRRALPQLKLSMHVYSADPAARFVILNDSRMTEGEKTPDEVTLEQIVPDGVILEFQGHRFFYPRDAL